MAQILPGWNVDVYKRQVQGAANYSHVPSYSFTSSLAKPGQISGMENASRMNLFWQNTNNVTYNTSFGDHHLTATAVLDVYKRQELARVKIRK